MKVALCTEWAALNSGQSGSLRTEYSAETLYLLSKLIVCINTRLHLDFLLR